MNIEKAREFFESKQRLISTRLILRPINEIDALDMYDYAKLDRVGPSAGWAPHKSIDETREIINNMMDCYLTNDNIGVFSIIDKKILKMIGTVGVHKLNTKHSFCEIGYVLNPKFWGKGITAEAVQTIIKWLFEEIEMYRIECGHYTFNNQSRRVIEKCGFKLEGVFREKKVLQDGNRTDLYLYSILKTEYDNKELPWQKE